MAKSLAQTPAPKSDRIYGSKVNAKGSASSEKSASKIVLYDEIIDSLKNKLSEFKENNDNDNITLNDLKAVYRRGLGAYSKSHRPTISGGKPNTRNAWAMARVNKFLLKASGTKVKKAYVQDDDLLKYNEGGEIDKLIQNGIVELNMYDTKPEHAKEYGFDSERPLYIQSIIVSEQHRGKGIGSKVMQHIVEYANTNGHDVIFGHITQKAEPSIDVIKSMLRKSGFKTIEGNNDFYKIMNEYKDGGEVDYKKDSLEFFKNELGIKSDVVLVNSKSNFDPKSMSIQMGIASNKKDGKYHIALNFNDTKQGFIRTLAHELVHIKQMEDGRLRYENGIIIFDNEKMTYDEYKKSYHSDNIPKFEDEAFILERKLQNMYHEKENSYKSGGEVEEHKETYKKWKSLVNMSYSELEKFYNSEEGKVAGLTSSEAKEHGIDSGRESARWIMKMKKTPVSEWTDTMWKWAKKQISFISRMRGNKGKLYDDKGRKTRKHTSLLIWGHNPEKYSDGGFMPDIRMEDTITRIDDPRLADISAYENGGEVRSKRLGDSTYEYKGYFIKKWDGGEDSFWNIWRDEYATDEVAIGFRTKKDAIEYINKYFENGGEVDDEQYFIAICNYIGFLPNIRDYNTEKHYKLSDCFDSLFDFMKSEEGLSYMPREGCFFSIEKLYYKGNEQIGKVMYKITGKEALKLHNERMLENGGEINQSINTHIMDEIKFNELPHIDTISGGDEILIKESVFVGNTERPKHIGDRYVHCQVMGLGGMTDSLNLKVLNSVGANAIEFAEVITRPITNVLMKGRKLITEPIANVTDSFAKGGINPDNKDVKEYFAHKSGNAGGVLVGNRHSEGGIKAINHSTNQPLEMEGGEVVITRGAVSNPKKYEFDGKEMTTRQILSKLNVDGGGVSFADGGDVPEKINCGCNHMKLGGDTISVNDFVARSESEYQTERLNEGVKKERRDHYDTLSKLNAGTITIEQALREIAQKEMKLDAKYPFAE
jgi:ribosomal protein S18 acetylase RimI-like enzyme